ncbi:MAG: ABC transporter permease [Acidimicrobiia bacterium]|nr:ABC transporter permease [Acidimicrobiia bacterium]
MTHGDRTVAPTQDFKRTPAWWLVFARETRDLWIGGKALWLVLTYSVLLGVVGYVLAANSELSILPPKEMVFELVKISIASAGFICLIIGADGVSGERERSTLEWLLLTPASRRQLVMGKFLAAVTPWPAAYLIGLPYWAVLSQGDEAFRIAAVWAGVLGSLLVPGLAALGMLVSLRSNTNRTSMFVALGLYLLVLVPTQLPGTAQTGAMGKLLKKVSPMESTYHFLEKVTVNSRTVDEVAGFIRAPALFAILTIGALAALSTKGLKLEAGMRSSRRFRSRFTTGAVIVGTVAALMSPAPRALAQTDGGLTISVDTETSIVNAGDPLLFTTAVSNLGLSAQGPLIIAMNIINLDAEGDIVDPEDWSPERTQYITELLPGTTVRLDWRINAILAGDYMVYMVMVPEPSDELSTTTPITSSGIHLTVMAFTRLNPLGVLPLVVTIPVLILGAIGFVIWRQRRKAEPI